ncbi:MAG TPA: hypothetical protein VGD78_12665 [Chthoniobacterales bacterium]
MQAETTSQLRELVDNWLADVQRRGTELYAVNEGNGVQYLSFEGRGHVRYSVDVDYTLAEITLQVNDPASPAVVRETVGLTAQNLRALAKRIAPLREGQACIPVSLLAQLAVLTHAYRRLVADFDQARRIRTSTDTAQEIEAELRHYLTPEEQRRTDNPFITSRLKSVPAGH